MNTYRIPFTLKGRNLRYSFHDCIMTNIHDWPWTRLQKHESWQLGRWFRLPETPRASPNSSLHATNGAIIIWKLSLRPALTGNIAAPQLWHHHFDTLTLSAQAGNISSERPGTSQTIFELIPSCIYIMEGTVRQLKVLLTCPNRPVFKGYMNKSDADLWTAVSCF